MSIRRVTLWNLEGVAAIILEPSGTIYSNQTCGNTCLQPEAEGVLVPFNNDPPPAEPAEALWCKLRGILENVHALTDELADRVDAELAAHPDTRIATVDRTRLDRSHEAWVFVDIDPEPECLLQGFGKTRAILTWPNSD